MNILAAEKHIQIGRYRFNKGQGSFYTDSLEKLFLTIPQKDDLLLDWNEVLIDGVPCESLEDLVNFLESNLFSLGGGNGQGVADQNTSSGVGVLKFFTGTQNEIPPDEDKDPSTLYLAVLKNPEP